MATARLNPIAAELCALPLARFTAERNARAKAARTAGDRDLADRISALPKPTTAAWIVTAIVREAPERLEHLLALGAALLHAQEDGDRERLRALTAERRTLLAAVVDEAAEREETAGRRLGAGVREEVERTLSAAITDPVAAAAVRSGRLVRALDADGLEPDGLADVVAGEPPAVPEAPPRRAPRREADHRAAERERERALERARARAAATGSAARDADAAVDDLRSRLDEAERAAREARSAADEAAAEVERLSGD